jgi:hypothetical protein
MGNLSSEREPLFVIHAQIFNFQDGIHTLLNATKGGAVLRQPSVVVSEEELPEICREIYFAASTNV